MPTYRVYYTERQVGTGRVSTNPTGIYRGPGMPSYAGSQELIHETEWEDLLEAASAEVALDEFFHQHGASMEDVQWLDDHDVAHAVSGLSYETGRSYIWMEEGRLMEYQGIDEIKEGRTVCPFCGGKGAVDGSVAVEYAESWDDRPDHLLADIEG